LSRGESGRLRLDIIYIQAKRWKNTVPVREVRDFSGALLGKKDQILTRLLDKTFDCRRFVP
jgi:hypothetical protein